MTCSFRTARLLALILVLAACHNSRQPLARTTPTLDNVNRFMAAGGLSRTGAAFLAMSALELVSAEKDHYQFRVTFPTKTPADLTVSFRRGQNYTPTAEERAAGPGQFGYGARFTHEVSGTTYRFALSYFLPDGVLQVSTGRPGRVRLARVGRGNRGGMLPAAPVGYLRAALPATAPLPQGGEESGVQVIFEATLTQAGKEFVSTLEEAIQEGILGEGDSPGAALGGMAIDVAEGFETSQEHTEMVEELNEIEELAREPTNPLTEKAYEEDPGLKQSILDEIADVRSELQWNTAAQFLNKELVVGAGLLTPIVGNPVIAVAMSGVGEWNSRTLKQVIKERIEALKKRVKTGYMNPKANKPPEPGEYKGPADVKEKPPERKRGMWRATYEAVQISTVEEHTTRVTDRGSFDFTVDRNGKIKGDGSGHYGYHDVYPDALAEGGVGYRFTVEGTTDPEVNFSPGGSTPDLVKLTITYSDGHTLSRPTVNFGPLLFVGGIKLQEGTYYYKGPAGDTRSITLQKPLP